MAARAAYGVAMVLSLALGGQRPLGSAPATPPPGPPAPAAAAAEATGDPAARNLKVLPPDWTRAQVVDRVMKKWTGDLGVRCQYCHVGEESQPFSEWDFASDAKPTKQRAREMYVMLGEINRQLGGMQSLHAGGAPLSASCFTCHRGAPRPRRIEEVFEETRSAKGLAAAVTEYRELRAQNLSSGSYDFTVKPLIRLARERLAAEDTAGAETVLALAADLGFDTLSTRSMRADVALAQGDRAAALAHLQKALAFAQNPAERQFVEEQLQRTQGEGEAPPP